MKNFHYSIPTEIFFGKGEIKRLPDEIKKYGNRVLLVYGGGSIKKIGLYDEIKKLFDETDIILTELGGVEPNPRITSVREGVKLCRENNIDIILAVGGGSTIDCAKVIAAGTFYENDAWDIVKDPSKITGALPLATVLTLSATGSEMDKGAVITNWETHEKLGTGHPSMAPKFSVLDPSYTFSVSKRQTVAGTADIMAHVFEVYFSETKEAFLADRMAESILKTCIKYGPVAIKEPENYEARANLMWSSSLAINGLLSYGKKTSWSVHAMEHELSAFYDVTHGEGLAVLIPSWMEYMLNDKTLSKFAEYGINVWNIDKNKNEIEIAAEAINKTKAFFISLGIPSSLAELNVGEEYLEEMSKRALRYGKLGSFFPFTSKDVLNIFKNAFN